MIFSERRGGALFSSAISNAASLSIAPNWRAVSMNLSNCCFSSGGGGLRAGMMLRPYSSSYNCRDQR